MMKWAGGNDGIPIFYGGAWKEGRAYVLYLLAASILTRVLKFAMIDTSEMFCRVYVGSVVWFSFCMYICTIMGRKDAGGGGAYNERGMNNEDGDNKVEIGSAENLKISRQVSGWMDTWIH